MKRIITLGLVTTSLFSMTMCGEKTQKKETEAVVQEQVKYQENFDSIKENYKIPEWFNDAKFGIFIHWGPYAVPAFGSEWYGRNMYMDTAVFTAQLKNIKDDPSPVYIHHLKTYGSLKEFGYKDFIPMFKGENFDAAEWISLFKKSGAKYVVPVAEHHDSFAMYASSHTRWNAKDMGPKRDILGELFKEGRAQGLKMGASSHLAFNWSFFNKKEKFDTVDPAYSDLYSPKGKDLKEPISQEFKDLWWKRTKEIIDNYQPDILWFDFFWDSAEFKEYHPKVAAYYYNKGEEWNKGVVLQDKNLFYEAFPEGTYMQDLERGKMSDIKKDPWQTDTSVGKNSWGYIKEWKSKTPNKLIDDLIDITSKNGCMLLNVGPKADGTIPQDQADILLEMGKWLDVNGEAIFNTNFWKTFGEGPTSVAEGYMSEHKKEGAFNEKDFRFTKTEDNLYVIGMEYPKDNKAVVTTLTKSKEPVKAVSLLGSNKEIIWEQTEEGLKVTLPTDHPTDYAYALKITQ